MLIDLRGYENGTFFQTTLGLGKLTGRSKYNPLVAQEFWIDVGTQSYKVDFKGWCTHINRQLVIAVAAAGAEVETFQAKQALPVEEPTTEAVADTAKQSNPKDLLGVRKAPASCISQLVLAEAGVAMLEGAAKYGRFNYRAVGVLSSVYFDAARRHILAWWEGQDIDPDSGIHHLTKAITSLAVLRDAQIMHMETDDRPPALPPEELIAFLANLDKISGEILDRHKDKNPHHFTQAERKAK